ncbi:hypothetical protein HZB94_02510 [Candidatus Falkowbacteria bacterium]|nr:hypothetical protein [Candidatus Falkowbacteria bacterium]
MRGFIVFLFFPIIVSCFEIEAKPSKKHSVRQIQSAKPKTTAVVPSESDKPNVCPRNPALPADKIDVQERICSARELLKSERAEMKICEKKKMICRGKGTKRHCGMVVTAKPICYRTIILASMDVKTGRLAIIEMIRLKNGKWSRIGYAIHSGASDGVDTEYEVRSPPGQVVLGIQYPLSLRTHRGLERVRAVYTPYSDALVNAFPELIEVGYLYLFHELEVARQKITEAGVDVADINWETLFALVLVEHLTNEVVEDKNVERETRRVLSTIGANQELAYRYSVSSAKARGIAQIIPRTWNALHRRYPKLVSADFYRGTATHSIALVTQILLAKEDLKFLFSQKGWRKNPSRREEFLRDSRGVGEYLALAYNGGAPRAYRWLESGKKIALPREGLRYIQKFNQVWKWHQDVKRRTSRAQGKLAL